MSGPEIAVVVPSHARATRLARLLDALAAQTLPHERWQAIVVHDDGTDSDTHRLLTRHDLTAAGTLQAIAYTPGAGSAAGMRNAGWRAARAPLIAFTDDDCHPPPEWLDRALTVAREHPWAVVQGRTRPDPDEVARKAGPRLHRTLSVRPPTMQAQTSNIVYARALLERLGGFDERYRLPFGEDVDLGLRARRAGAGFLGAPEIETLHAYDTVGVADAVRGARRWGQLALVVHDHPEYRWGRLHPLGRFCKPSHARLTLSVAALGVAALRPAPRWRPAVAAATLAWPAVTAYEQRSIRPGWVRRVPRRLVLDVAETAALARASARRRTLFL